jgi:hypothetical protein
MFACGTWRRWRLIVTVLHAVHYVKVDELHNWIYVIDLILLHWLLNFELWCYLLIQGIAHLHRSFTFSKRWGATHNEFTVQQIKNFKATWNEAGLKKLNFDTFGTAYPNVPKQKNVFFCHVQHGFSTCSTYSFSSSFFLFTCSNDCGIFSMKYLEVYCARNPAQYSFSHLDIPAFRMKYAHDMIMSDHNQEEDAKFLVASFNS